MADMWQNIKQSDHRPSLPSLKFVPFGSSHVLFKVNRYSNEFCRICDSIKREVNAGHHQLDSPSADACPWLARTAASVAPAWSPWWRAPSPAGSESWSESSSCWRFPSLRPLNLHYLSSLLQWSQSRRENVSNILNQLKIFSIAGDRWSGTIHEMC